MSTFSYDGSMPLDVLNKQFPNRGFAPPTSVPRKVEAGLGDTLMSLSRFTPIPIKDVSGTSEQTLVPINGASSGKRVSSGKNPSGRKAYKSSYVSPYEEAKAYSPEQVMDAQIGLKQAGLYGGKIDGKWGPKTEAARNIFLENAANTKVAASLRAGQPAASATTLGMDRNAPSDLEVYNTPTAANAEGGLGSWLSNAWSKATTRSPEEQAESDREMQNIVNKILGNRGKETYEDMLSRNY